jgi:hypothetical protein
MRSRFAFVSRRVSFLASLAIVVGSSTGTSQHIREIPSLFSLINPKLDTVTLATVGPWRISATEFMLSYEYGPAFVKREKDSKKHYLIFMLYEKLLAFDAQQRGLDKESDVQQLVKQIEADLATEELYRDDVLSKVDVSDRSVALGVEQERVHLAVRWIYAPSAGQIHEQVRVMKEGVSFDSLFALQLRRGVKAEDRTMETTRFRLRVRNPLLAAVVDTLPPGIVSPPVQGPDGWYLVKIVDEEINPVVTQSEGVKMGKDVRRTLTQHVADSLSDDYAQRMIVDQHPVILRESFNAVQAYLGKKFLRREKFDEWGLASRKGAKELKDLSQLDTIASRVLVQMKKKSLDVRSFLDWYRLREPYVKLTLTSPQAFFQSVEGLIWRMVRDRLLTHRAFERGLQKRTSVRRQKEWWKEKFLYLANKQRLAATITDSLPLLRKYYEQHTHDFCDTSGVVKAFEDAREDVWREYYSYELKKNLLHEILRLKEKYGVRIDEAALNKMAVDIENDPRAIDVYTVKTGGIYPRTAFPSIDYDWQTWQ